MKCNNCFGQWTPPPNFTIMNCPFCGLILDEINVLQKEKTSPEVILRNIMETHGKNIFHYEQIFFSIISKLFEKDFRNRKLLLISLIENIPQQLFFLEDRRVNNPEINVIKERLLKEGIINCETIESIISLWNSILNSKPSCCKLEIVFKNGYYSFKNKLGEYITTYKYEDVIPFSECISLVYLNGKWGYIDWTGKELTPMKYSIAKSFRDGMAAVYYNGFWGFVNKMGKEIGPIKYDYVDSFHDGFSIVQVNGKYGFIDKSGKEVTTIVYDNVLNFSDGLAGVNLNGKWGFIDIYGKESVPLKYDEVNSFNEGLASARLHNKYGFIDKTGKEVIPFIFDESYYFFRRRFEPVPPTGIKRYHQKHTVYK